MMKTIRHMFALLAMFGGALAAATVPQNSTNLYYFSRPNLPSNIVGRIVGVPAEYSIPRSEDVAWLREAWCERAALRSRAWTGLEQSRMLVPSFGSWPLAESNRFAQCTTAVHFEDGAPVTNVIVGYNWQTNFGAGIDTAHIGPFRVWDDTGVTIPDYYETLSNPQGDTSGFLDPDAVLATSPVVATNAYVTNVWQFAYTTNAVSNAWSVITMPMTNGIVSVYTNIWTVHFPVLVTSVATNIRYLSNIDLAFPAGQVQGYTNLPPLSWRWGGVGSGEALSCAAITNHYAWLAGQRRLADQPQPTGVISNSTYSWAKDEPSTNKPAVVSSDFRFLYLAGNRHWAELVDGNVETTSDYSGSDQMPNPTIVDIHLMTSWPTNAITAGGVDRFQSARVWAVFDLSQGERSDAYGPDGIQYYGTNRDASVSVYLGTATAGVNHYGYLTLDLAAVDLLSARDDALSAAGFYVPQRDYVPSLRFPVPTPTGGQWRTTLSETFIETDCTAYFVAIVDFQPWTKMPGGINE